MSQNYDLTGNTLLVDGVTSTGAITGNVTGNISGALTSTSPLTVAGVGIYVGAGVPSASAAKGSLYLNTTGSSTATRLYVNNGTTNWVAITTAS